jgi:hypothetical protein
MPLCPHCGYPLLLDRQPPVDDSARKIVRKPTEDPAAVHRTQAMPPPMQGPPRFPAGPFRPPPQQMQVRGPVCSSCGRANPPHRKRCETCGQELWPGAAYPARMAPPAPPPVPAVRKRRSWWWLVLILLAILAVGAVWLLAWLL